MRTPWIVLSAFAVMLSAAPGRAESVADPLQPQAGAGASGGQAAAASVLAPVALAAMTFNTVPPLALVAPAGAGLGHWLAGDPQRATQVAMMGPLVGIAGAGLGYAYLQLDKTAGTNRPVLGPDVLVPLTGWAIAATGYTLWASWDAYRTAEARRPATRP